jgi:SpoVK/Ycf46/Vps4 family AAA+-type ATPase
MEVAAAIRAWPRVAEDWRLDRFGNPGVTALFAGDPGTGKTLAAEVIATEVGIDLMIVDLSRLVSKWIGETEKNLAEVFDAAERTQAVLLFDEADALFGKRTEVSDAHDRYANLETAYLLARLERFEGLAVLSTNLRQNIDPAFIRRLEFVVDFDGPETAERELLWRVHLPNRAPLAGDVDPAELAHLYELVGGHIRNAAVAAAFLAAAEDQPVGRGHLLRAVRREYAKAGRAFPGTPDHAPAL